MKDIDWQEKYYSAKDDIDILLRQIIEITSSFRMRELELLGAIDYLERAVADERDELLGAIDYLERALADERDAARRRP